MSSSSPPASKSLVLVGGGHAHVYVLKSLHNLPRQQSNTKPCVDATLITPSIYTPYSGMLPGYISRHYTLDDIHLNLQKLCAFGNVNLILASAVEIVMEEAEEKGKRERKGGWVVCSDGQKVKFDILSINAGISPTLPPSRSNENDTVASLNTNNANMAMTNMMDMVTPVKPISTFSSRYEALCDRLHKSREVYNEDNPFRLLVVGGGAGGIELALSAQYALQRILGGYCDHHDNRQKGVKCTELKKGANTLKVTIATRGSSLLSSHNAKVRRILTRILGERNIEICCNTEAKCVAWADEKKPENEENNKKSNNSIDADNATKLKKLLTPQSKIMSPPITFHECLWCTSASAPSWLSSNTPFDTTNDGFVKVSDTYESLSHKGVFAAGDCCHMTQHPRPKAGVFAVRAGPILYKNLLASLFEKQLHSHKPQTDFLGLISTGDKYAVASRGRFALEGAYLWKWKDRIDRKWMDGYMNLISSVSPSMESREDNDRNYVGSEK